MSLKEPACAKKHKDSADKPKSGASKQFTVSETCTPGPASREPDRCTQRTPRQTRERDNILPGQVRKELHSIDKQPSRRAVDRTSSPVALSLELLSVRGAWNSPPQSRRRQKSRMGCRTAERCIQPHRALPDEEATWANKFGVGSRIHKSWTENRP